MNDNKLHTKYGLFTAICMVVGIVIGSGVFFKATPVIVNNGGSMAMSILTVATVGAVMLICAYVFSMMAERISHVNGAVDYAEAACGRVYGYALGWFMSTIYYPCIGSTLAWITADYTTVLFGISDKGNLRMALAALYLIISYFINSISPKIAGKLQISTTAVKLIPLALMAVVGTVIGLISGQTVESLTTGVAGAEGGKGFFGAVVAFAFAYEGWIIATSINAEIKDPKKNLPRALLLGMLITVGVYVSYFLGLAGVLSPEEIYAPADTLPIAAFTALFGGNRVFGIIAYVFVIISCFGTLNGIMLGGCRGIYSLAERGQGPSPKLFGRIDETNNMPTNSAIFSLALSALWLTQWEFGLIEGVLPEWLCFENDELPIITLYLAYIPVFITFMIRGRDLKGWQRFVIIPLGILACLFMVYSAAAAYKIQTLYYLAVFAIFMAVGMAFYRVGGKTLATLALEKLRLKKPEAESDGE